MKKQRYQKVKSFAQRNLVAASRLELAYCKSRFRAPLTTMKSSDLFSLSPP